MEIQQKIKHRGPGRPPGKKRLSSSPTKRSINDTDSDFAYKRRRSAPVKFEDNATDKSFVNHISVESTIMKRPRGRPPLSAGRGGGGRNQRGGGRVPSKSFLKSNTQFSKNLVLADISGPSILSNGVSRQHQALEFSQLTQVLLSHLMKQEPKSATELTRAIPEISIEQTQTILDTLHVLGIVIILRTRNEASTSNSAKSNTSLPLYALAAFARGPYFHEKFSLLKESTKLATLKMEATESRILELEALSMKMPHLVPAERVESLKTLVSSFLQKDQGLLSDNVYESIAASCGLHIDAGEAICSNQE